MAGLQPLIDADRWREGRRMGICRVWISLAFPSLLPAPSSKKPGKVEVKWWSRAGSNR
jgi:hypothetical protein